MPNNLARQACVPRGRWWSAETGITLAGRAFFSRGPDARLRHTGGDVGDQIFWAV